jgi:predicted patatin/cPLA2 family phospholipase
MRGVVSAAMVAALEARGLLGCFDSIHGSSAGACAGAYFLAGQAGLGARIYYEDINNKHFIDLWRPLRGRPIMDTHFLIDHVMRNVKPLDVGRILKAKNVLNIVTTEAKLGRGHSYRDFRNAEHFFAILKGSITIPVIAGRPVEVDGVQLIDGGMVEQIALRCAMNSQPTHALVLLTRKEGELERPGPGLQLPLELLILRILFNAKLAAVYKQRHDDINQVVAAIRNPRGNVAIEAIARPAEASEVDRLSTDAALLRAADEEARQAVFAYLDGVQ